ncbi:MAG: hypothetical protein COX43_03205 [Parcubacteria group bacterium CG23_combo_of_CG06-09_8_20_14_all_35_9]|nr:MAG: hypothetical protein COX43_03205 [Parcubacteria group bacterium CG23_combo_of_CG06-09_8_20_14_all_35_9]
MEIIDKIEIKKFRSIYNEKISLNSLTIFSGKNNSGKSNVLKALNLFFNSKSSFDQEYQHERDYNKAYTAFARGKREIEISLYFKGQGKSALKEKFSIYRRFVKGEMGGYEYHSNDKSIQAEIDKKNGKITREFTRFRNKLEYFYIPAIRDRFFIKQLFVLFERLLNDEKGKDFRDNMLGLSTILSEKSINISDDFKKFINLPTRANLSTSIADVLGAIVIDVESGLKIQKKAGEKRIHPAYVDLFSSGDGILMSYIPHFLSHVCKKMKNKNFIWGFEEPENSLEYSKIENLTDKFYNDFSKNAQILITTHSPAFIKLKDQTHVNFYRVYINSNDPTQESQIKTITDIEKQLSLFPVRNKEYESLEQELGIVEMSKEVGKYMTKLQNDRIRMEKSNEELANQIKDQYPNKIFIYEDKNTSKLWEKLFKDKKIKDIKIYCSEGSDKNEYEIIFRKKVEEKDDYKPLIFRQIDRDGLTNFQIKKVEEKKCNQFKKAFKKYVVEPLPVNEIENFAVISSKNKKRFKKIINKHKDVLEDATRQTMGEKIKVLYKQFDYKEDMFKDDEKTITLMLTEARKDKAKLFSGKEICKLEQNFAPIKDLISLSDQEYPQELKDYLKKIKDFYESTN